MFDILIMPPKECQKSSVATDNTLKEATNIGFFIRRHTHTLSSRQIAVRNRLRNRNRLSAATSNQMLVVIGFEQAPEVPSESEIAQFMCSSTCANELPSNAAVSQTLPQLSVDVDRICRPLTSHDSGGYS